MGDGDNPPLPPHTLFSAAPALIGYLFQCRYALLGSLRRLRAAVDFVVSIETLDDVVFQQDGSPPDLLQTKHHLNRTADLTDASPDLWKSIRVWCEGRANSTIPCGSTFFLITTAIAPKGTVAHYLKIEPRDVNKALERLNATAESSTNRTNVAAYASFRRLNSDEKTELMNAIVVIDGVPAIGDLDSSLREVVFYSVELKFLDLFLQRLEGWWLRRVIKHLADNTRTPILSQELQAETNRLREQFKQDNLPIDDEIMNASVDATGYQDRIFVHQLRLIDIGNPRILQAIRDYFRAFEQRTRWVRDRLLFVGELDRYQDRLVEEWDIQYQQMRDDLGEHAADEAKKDAAKALYKWVENNLHPGIRSSATHPAIARGTYQMLADIQRVGWHADFLERLKELLEPQVLP